MASKITLNDIIRYMSGHSVYSQQEISKFINIILDIFKNSFKNRCSVELRGLGTFITKEHKPKYIQLNTKIIDSKNHFVILFKESSELSKKINPSPQYPRNGK
ncbi:MAG: HU family DNA-binding protein [bacterium]|nr:HU family DNA-binding protein [bacterium]